MCVIFIKIYVEGREKIKYVRYIFIGTFFLKVLVVRRNHLSPSKIVYIKVRSPHLGKVIESETSVSGWAKEEC